MNVLDALGDESSLYRAHRRMSGPLAQALAQGYPGDLPSRQEVWLKRYENFRLARLQRSRQTPTAELPFSMLRAGHDHSQLKRNLRPMLIELMGIEHRKEAREDIENQSFIFPVVREFDVRMLPGDFPPAIVITEGTLDLVRFFADAVSVCRALNAAALPQIAEIQQRETGRLPGAVLLEWLTFDPNAREDVIDTVRKLAASPALGASLAGRGKVDPSSVLATAILELAMDLVARYVQQPFSLPKGLDRAPYSDDAEYLAALIVAFMALHEVAHVGLCHGREESYASFLRSHLDPLQAAGTTVNPFLDFRLRDRRSARVFIGDNTPVDEIQADLAAVKWVGESYREPLLAAATLWLAALEAPFIESAGRAQHLGELGTASSYPSFVLRVKALNQAFAAGERRRAIDPVLRAVAARSNWYVKLGGIDIRNSFERNRDMKLFETLMTVLQKALPG